MLKVAIARNTWKAINGDRISKLTYIGEFQPFSVNKLTLSFSGRICLGAMFMFGCYVHVWVLCSCLGAMFMQGECLLSSLADFLVKPEST